MSLFGRPVLTLFMKRAPSPVSTETGSSVVEEMPSFEIDEKYADKIKLCRLQRDPIWKANENGVFPPFDDGYNEDFFADEQDRIELQKQKQILMLNEIYERAERRTRLQDIYQAAKADWEKSKESNAREEKFQSFKKKYSSSNKYNDESSGDEYFPNEEVIPEKQSQKNIAQVQTVSFQDFKDMQITAEEIIRFQKRSDFPSLCVGLLAKDTRLNVPIRIKSVRDHPEIVTQNGEKFSKSIMAMNLRNGDEENIPIDEIGNEEFTTDDYNNAIRLSMTKKEIQKALQARSTLRSFSHDVSKYRLRSYEDVINGVNRNISEVLYEHRVILEDMERRVEGLEEPDEDVLEELKAQRERVETLIRLKDERDQMARKSSSVITTASKTVALINQIKSKQANPAVVPDLNSIDPEKALDSSDSDDDVDSDDIDID